jgi:DnaJ-class molecular chaperone
MNKLVECPNCLGTGEEFFKGRFPRGCSTCKGEGVVDKSIENAFVKDLHIYNDDEEWLNI